jgi:hypothetical protein
MKTYTFILTNKTTKARVLDITVSASSFLVASRQAARELERNIKRMDKAGFTTRHLRDLDAYYEGAKV